MVAASFGLPAVAGSSGPNTSAETSAPEHSEFHPVFSLSPRQENNRRQTFSVDYWHQHAIRTVIRHLTFALAPQAMAVAEESPLQKHHIALLDSLSALLTLETRPPVIVRNIAQHRGAPPFLAFSVTQWRSKVQGIRAGPHIFC